MSFADDLEDFFKKLSEHWTDLIRTIYKNKGLPDELIYEPIVREQAQQLSKAIEQAFDESGYDTPDLKMREFLKKNVWEFSVAKNYNDNVALNNLLLKSDGSLRNWNDFKREAQKVVGKSIRYLKTEYNTVVIGAQKASLWSDIQKAKHLFPYLQFDVVLDGHTSDICKPLHGVIVSVDDPMLKHYFPPNHFNCRTTVRQLRKGVPTENYAVPDIPDAFKNNPGITGKVFTQKNSYIVNTPSDVLVLAPSLYKENERNKRYEGIEFEAHKIGKGVVEIYKHETLKDKQRKQTGSEFTKNKEALTLLAKQGEKYRMLPIVEDGQTNPDAFNLKTEKYVDVKVTESSNGKNVIQSALKEANRQGVKEVIIQFTKELTSNRDAFEALRATFKQGRAKNVETITFIMYDKRILRVNTARFK
ncbi:minor capsid protein [Capnocytophaga cynodegmi]|uniref:Phage head morphogenesis protein, SPP1 gp7 family n=1 Tax=Capnocytophaga cynodegmi TaxID=28189 RepID=A0A0B7HW62_9FLAO|nr:minor capsid protein [Capnocytophaga cynodegmi]CEN39347.1 Phage head morphogenesis protein, SPP1 gp7 family [Capnocytophaga cynodegmi]CEN41723.1 Phage head morphogenesis protein, SPP1 gp7 family [Capnocytophaga cynodegmi]